MLSTMIRVFFFDDGDDDDDLESKKSIWWFFDKSLKLHNAPVLEVLLISLGPRCPSDANIGNWVAKAVERGVVVVNFNLRWSAGPARLPKSLYTCETLKELTLSNKVLVDFPSSSCLPSLNRLQLFSVVYKEEASLARFLSSCPVLGILIMKRKKSDNLTNLIMKVPSLRMLWYRSTTWMEDDTDVVDSDSCLVIDTPALIKFDVADYSRNSWSIGNMPCLEEAYISASDLSIFDKIITASSAILSLDLTFEDEMLVRCSTLRFSRLIKLSLDPNRSDWLEPLLLLLKNTPKLEQLLVNYAVDRGVIVVKFKLHWSAGPTTLPKSLYTCKTLKELTLSNKVLVDLPSSSPSCLPSLEILQLSCVVYKDEDSFTRFLSSCPVLGILIVDRKKSDNLTNFIVKVPSLRMLWYYDSTWLEDDTDVVDSGSCLVIDTPALIKFDVTDYSRHSWSIGNMPCLEEAHINVEPLSIFDEIITACSAILSLHLTFTDEMIHVHYTGWDHSYFYLKILQNLNSFS
ncbi:unnamed protein product [Eruca vesicaria subsp. sativa]|uniref:F-box/LRR-repeat protein 15/At3g58940/PEG3-like LRR domain-containing protein n=1 Tax=Eruca vesicaria subsp. sativa TaxID=29727 RepID=A0ABC8KPS4_ERUVS|nr:unnamed protein product [Eruca vesicaria subsp. sativa]